MQRPRQDSSWEERCKARTHHSRSLYMMVKKTWRKRLTALMRTASRYSHASPDIIADLRPMGPDRVCKGFGRRALYAVDVFQSLR